jgi:hypothetical protein
MPASGVSQTLTINGSGFLSGATLAFDPPTGANINSTASKLTFVSSSQITYQFNNGGDAGIWTVVVSNPDGQSSSPARFTVKGGGARRGVDYSYSHPSATGLKAAGYEFAIRYVSGSGNPNPHISYFFVTAVCLCPSTNACQAVPQPDAD